MRSVPSGWAQWDKKQQQTNRKEKKEKKRKKKKKKKIEQTPVCVLGEEGN